MNKKYIIILTFFAVFCAFFACDNDEQCRQDNYVMMKISFYKSVTDTFGMQTHLPNSLIIYASGAGLDLLYNGLETQSIDLPLNKFADSSSFEIKMNDTLETFTVWHTNHNEYLSFECGCLTTFTIDSFKISYNYVDSVSLIKKSVNAKITDNFSFYRYYGNR